ncbi:DUF4177 domain-containing protein [Natronococcus sp. A-GB7]|uniref:DUF4177 domain-containing protein n=1 Tax=Natronococcus sp. A-GB7 TaxID=3037649 RepID=UPI00241E46F8|nr:DUF4177 domain-containing protein [Natronococcus sp. A-GB7]MDG5820705.1 DUF4177 domain-containing protein [Natronococcus sp. A-GB7]
MSSDRDTRWEYKAIEPPTELTKRESANPEERLNELGADGWRLVETVSYDGGGTKFLLFERRLED